GPAGHRHAIWVATLSAAVLLPIARIRTGAPTPAPQFTLSPRFALASPEQAAAAARPSALPPAPAPLALPSPPPSRTISIAETTATILLAAYLLFVFFRLVRLVW